MMPQDQVVNQVVPVAQCRGHPRNYNLHDDGQIGRLQGSLRTFGQVRSIVVQDDGEGRFLVVAGAGVVEAARRNGLAGLRADVIPFAWDEVKVQAYLAADNELARLGSPDDAQLALLVADVQKSDGELAALAAGTDERLDELLEMLALEDELGGELSSGGWPKRNLGHVGMIKAVLPLADLGTFERAVRATGLRNRGEAVIAICRAYLGDEALVEEALAAG